MLSINDLKPGTLFSYEGDPYEALEVSHSKIAQRRAVLQTKIKNLRTGAVLQKNFSQGEKFKEAEIVKRPIVFVYHHRGTYVFSEKEEGKKRFSLSQNELGDAVSYLKQNLELEALMYQGKILTVALPIKLDLMVADAPPGVRGDTAQGGTKSVTLETGMVVLVPLFIENGDIIRVNTHTGEYVERVKKSS